MKLTNVLLPLAALASLASGYNRYYSSKTNNGNSTELIQCVEEMKSMLERRPRSTHPSPSPNPLCSRDFPVHRLAGYRCGTNTFLQFGGSVEWEPIKNNLKAFRKCQSHLYDAALTAKDWFLCEVVDFWGYRIVAFSPMGYMACWKDVGKGYKPCVRREDWDN
ncbi:hypothetical protein CERZMDRAFT_89178 [Cercospora zeae-maydis SCOH1-5]|uniref:Avirulence Effector AvrLm4-7 domain-containing protein n=1 Tax=Cercospora zeae-maydis SCOH1-5 TaxID=717836 RepID=A0A6A6EZH4_9PEZI|nr:hypothetical protein CERZMDRAFT_89178 [Cercospora zeae-maydis SCOH1-5]